MDELEIVQYPQIKGLTVFVNAMAYRTPHFHQEWELLWVLDAPLTVSYGHEKMRIEAGDIVLLPPNMLHEFSKDRQDCTFLCIQFSPSVFGISTGRIPDDIELKHHLSKEDDVWVRRTALEIARAYFYRGDLYELSCFGWCGLLLHRLLTVLPHHEMTAEEAAELDRKNARLMRLVRFVDENFMHKIRLSDFAAQEGCSTSYLSRFIRDTMNQTFQDYVNSVRFNHACKLISAGQDTMLSVSAQSGFSDYRYFSRAFQKAYGMTPAAYARNAHDAVPEDTHKESSPHSQEQFLTRGQSLFILNRFEEQIKSRM